MQIKLSIPGNPIGKKRPRFARRGKFVTTYNDQETEESKVLWDIRQQLQKILPDCQRRFVFAVAISMRFDMPIPKSTSKTLRAKMEAGNIPHIKKPDIDNLIKFYLDVMAGEVFLDDNQIYSIDAQKFYSTDPGTLITIRSAI